LVAGLAAGEGRRAPRATAVLFSPKRDLQELIGD